MAKQKYTPHRALISKVSDSEDRYYRRDQNRQAIAEEMEEIDDSPFAEDIREELENQNFLAEHGFHIVGDFR